MKAGSPLFQAAVEATEEAVLNSLFVGDGMTGIAVVSRACRSSSDPALSADLD